MGGDRRAGPRAVEIDGVLVARLDRRRAVGIAAVEHLEALDVGGGIGVGARHQHRVGVRLVDEIVVGQVHHRRGGGHEAPAGAVGERAGDRRVGEGREAQPPAGPDRGRARQVQPAGEDGVGALAVGEARGERQAGGAAPALVGRIAADAGRRREAGGGEADAVLRAGQEVGDHQRRVGVVAVDDGAGNEPPDDLESDRADRGLAAEIEIAGRGIGRAAVAERRLREARGKVAPGLLRRGAGKQRQEKVARRIAAAAAPHRAEAGDRPFADREHRRGGVGVARQAGMAAALAAARLGILRKGAEGAVPDHVRREPRRAVDDRDRQRGRRRLHLQAGVARHLHGRGCGAEEAHRASSLVCDQSVKKRGARPLAASALFAATTSSSTQPAGEKAWTMVSGSSHVTRAPCAQQRP